MKNYLLVKNNDGRDIVITSDREYVTYNILKSDYDVLFLDDILRLVYQIEENYSAFLTREEKKELETNGFENLSSDTIWKIYIHWLIYWDGDI